MAYRDRVQKGFIEQQKEGVIFYTIPSFSALGVRHGFTSRIGGVSDKGICDAQFKF